jgi:hypothetical protein
MAYDEEILSYERDKAGNHDVVVDGEIGLPDDFSDSNLTTEGYAPPAVAEQPPTFDTKLEAPPKPAQIEVGKQAVEIIEQLPPATSYNPEAPEVKVVPSEHDRLYFAGMTPTLFDTMKNDDKRFVALSIRLANRRGRIGLLPEGMADYAREWLKEDVDKGRTPRYTSYEKKLQRILDVHKSAGDAIEPWIDISRIKSKGKMVDKASLMWNRDYHKMPPPPDPVEPTRYTGHYSTYVGVVGDILDAQERARDAKDD